MEEGRSFSQGGEPAVKDFGMAGAMFYVEG